MLNARNITVLMAVAMFDSKQTQYSHISLQSVLQSLSLCHHHLRPVDQRHSLAHLI